MFPQAKSIFAATVLATTNGGTATARIDTLGYDFATIDILGSTVAATTNTPSVLKLQEADDTNATSFADVTGAVGGTSFTIPNWFTNTATQQSVKFNVDCRTRKRYLQVVISPRTTQDFQVVANLMRAEQSPVTASLANALVLVGV